MSHADTIRRALNLCLTGLSDDARISLDALVAEREEAVADSVRLGDDLLDARAENQKLRDALGRQVDSLTPLDTKIHFSLHVGTVGQMRADLLYLRDLLGDALDDARAALDGTPSAAQTLEDPQTTERAEASSNG